MTPAGITLVAQRLINRRVVSSLAVLKQVEDDALSARVLVVIDGELGLRYRPVSGTARRRGPDLRHALRGGRA